MRYKNQFIIILTLILTMTSTHAVEEFNPDEDETNCSNCAPELVSTESFKKSTPPLIIEVFYIGSPIDQSKLLVIKSDCKGDGQYKVIYEKQDCDFSHFTSKASKFTFTNFYYNPLNGKCDRKATVEKIDTKKYCKKPKTIR